MTYLFARSTYTFSVVIPPPLVDRWTRQINTSYDDLSPSEQDSDRAEADKFLAIIGAANNDRVGDVYTVLNWTLGHTPDHAGYFLICASRLPSGMPMTFVMEAWFNPDTGWLANRGYADQSSPRPIDPTTVLAFAPMPAFDEVIRPDETKP